MLYRERTHLHFGLEIRKAITENHKEIDDFFHNQIIQDWQDAGWKS